MFAESTVTDTALLGQFSCYSKALDQRFALVDGEEKTWWREEVRRETFREKMTDESVYTGWCNDLVLKFLDFYREEKIIWRAAHPQHKNRNNVYDAWKRIQNEMDQQFTVAELKKKEDSLMASFRTCRDKVKKSIRSGAGRDDVYKPTWFAFEKMATFLMDKDESRETINSEDILSQLKTDSQIDNPDYEESQDIEEAGETSFPVENSGIVMSTNSKNKTTHLHKKTKCENEDIKRKMDTAFKILESSISQPKGKDVCDIYGELLAAKLKAMDECTREVAMHDIDNYLFKMKRCNNTAPNLLLAPSTSRQNSAHSSSSKCSTTAPRFPSPILSVTTANEQFHGQQSKRTFEIYSDSEKETSLESYFTQFEPNNM